MHRTVCVPKPISPKGCCLLRVCVCRRSVPCYGGFQQRNGGEKGELRTRVWLFYSILLHSFTSSKSIFHVAAGYWADINSQQPDQHENSSNVCEDGGGSQAPKLQLGLSDFQRRRYDF